MCKGPVERKHLVFTGAEKKPMWPEHKEREGRVRRWQAEPDLGFAILFYIYFIYFKLDSKPLNAVKWRTDIISFIFENHSVYRLSIAL